jgi:hypothetical protein
MSDHKDHKDHNAPRDDHREADENRDPISGAKGAHPVGSGLGAAAGGAATGAAVGTVAGPIGTAVGVIVGGLVGGYIGKGVAEQIDPTEEHNYWRDEHRNRDYVQADRDYDNHYGPAYQYGWESYGKEAEGNPDQPRRFEDIEPDLGREWDNHRSETELDWAQAKPAARDSYNRVYATHTDAGTKKGDVN